MRIEKKGFGLLLALFFFLGVLCYGKYLGTGGFTTEKIHSHSFSSISFDFSAPEYRENMLDQPFYYLSKGRQAYVFGSQDGRYVIKFLRDQKYRPSLWVRASLFFHLLTQGQKRACAEQKERYARAVASYQIACQRLSEETQLIRVHLGSMHPPKKLFVLDRFSRRMSIDLGKTSYLLQRRGESLASFLLSVYRNHEEEVLKWAVRSFFKTVAARLEKKILVRDAHCTLQNMAVCEEGIIEIDVGSFYFDPDCNFKQEMNRSADPLREFVQKEMPEFFFFFEEESRRVRSGCDG